MEKIIVEIEPKAILNNDLWDAPIEITFRCFNCGAEITADNMSDAEVLFDDEAWEIIDDETYCCRCAMKINGVKPEKGYEKPELGKLFAEFGGSCKDRR